MFDKLLLVRPFCYLYLVFIVGAQDVPGMKKTAPEKEILQRKISEALGIGNDLKA